MKDETAENSSFLRDGELSCFARSQGGKENDDMYDFLLLHWIALEPFLLAFAKNFKYISISLQVCALVKKKQTLYLLSLCDLCHLCGDNEGLNIQTVQLHAINCGRLHSAKADFF